MMKAGQKWRQGLRGGFELKITLVRIIVNRLVMKPSKYQRSKQRCQDLCWKVHDHAQSFVLHSYTMNEFLSRE